MRLAFFLVIFLVVFFSTTTSYFHASAAITDDNDPQSNLEEKSYKLSVSYSENTDANYEVFVKSDETFTLGQSHSWVRDQTSRYNLVTYSLDGDDFIPISRLARGNFTMEIIMNSPHSVVFSAVPQFPIEVNGSPDFVFSPQSPTGDNWFDYNSEIEVQLQNTIETKQGKVREQLTGWALDKSNMRTISRSESGIFITPTISISNMHVLDFRTVTQFNIDVISDYGTITGAGWYDEGSTATIAITPPDEMLIRHVLNGWDDTTVESNENSARVLVDKPKTIVAKWGVDYSQVILIGMIPIGIGVALFVKRLRVVTVKKISGGEKPQENQQKLKKVQQVPPLRTVSPEVKKSEAEQIKKMQPPDTNYFKEITNYRMQKSIERLDFLLESGFLSNNKYKKLREKLENDS